jgi:hypothetical protein
MDVTIRQTRKGHRLDITKIYAYRAGGRVVFWGLGNTVARSIDEALEALRPVIEDLAATAKNDERPEPTWGGK